ncbi:bifunctional riboflavin kinase/FAD synthetase [Acidaminobacter sp. JC074]|uniref:bifunctional riboflavin kinase/FAD synthetase n=1 Tax=Acidaminobacter sp. JC074 TaxID=2530199 RepID=UPI001F1006CB|nr:bifunctional riboflavin kinase/FAD synthetase [Acidaminobacter sp. JC074]MCH4890913.1 bifunctional riboflavin kinase/FAD synthetase [Acidaminobacter sp. JC074]
MKVIRSLSEFKLEPSVVALGTFDGVHIAHKKVIEKVVKTAKEKGLQSVVYTFSNHPKELSDVETPKRLITPEQKISIIKKLGVDILIMVPFDETQLNMQAEVFLVDIVLKNINAKHIIVGYDYRFGKNAKGCVNMLKQYQAEYGYELEIIDPIRKDGILISSTLIRQHLLSGQVASANELLGRKYDIRGKVIHGKHMGRKLGFPTVNLKTDYEMSVLRPGVYMTETIIDKKVYPSVTNVGFNPTFNQTDFNIETYILDFDGDLYGETLDVLFIRFIRKEIRFDSLDALIEKIESDVQLTREFFGL